MTRIYELVGRWRGAERLPIWPRDSGDANKSPCESQTESTCSAWRRELFQASPADRRPPPKALAISPAKSRWINGMRRRLNPKHAKLH
jgi:hypothetical protein